MSTAYTATKRLAMESHPPITFCISRYLLNKYNNFSFSISLYGYIQMICAHKSRFHTTLTHFQINSMLLFCCCCVCIQYSCIELSIYGALIIWAPTPLTEGLKYFKWMSLFFYKPQNSKPYILRGPKIGPISLNFFFPNFFPEH